MTEPRMIPLYRQIASAVDARNNRRLKMFHLRTQQVPPPQNRTVEDHAAVDQYNQAVEWFNRWEDRLQRMQDVLPSGSGLDHGTEILLGDPGESIKRRSTGERLVFETSFHHMNDNGMYVKWTDHLLVVTPSLMFDFEIRVGGRDHNDIKDYIRETFDQALRVEYPDNHFTEE